MSTVTSIEELEKLDNVKLRAKCLEYGLPNVPITDTSRKILIRKLHTTMTGESSDKNSKKSKRETIHGTKIPTLVDVAAAVTNNNDNASTKVPPSRPNRRTIAGTMGGNDEDISKKPQISLSQKPAPASVIRRRQVEAANTRQTLEPIKSILIEDDEDDIILMEAAESTEKSNQSKLVVRDRRSRSVSLSKTGIVTTSYSQEVEKVPPTIAECVEDEKVEAERNNIWSNESHLNYVPETIATNAVSNKGLSQRPIGFERPIGFGTFDSVLKTGSETYESLYSGTNNAIRSSVEREFNKSTFPSRCTLGEPFVSASMSAATPSRRYRSTGYATPTPKYDALYNENSDDYENDDDIGMKTVDSPYLSSFARKLERLKSDQLNFDVKDKKKYEFTLQNSWPTWSEFQGEYR